MNIDDLKAALEDEYQWHADRSESLLEEARDAAGTGERYVEMAAMRKANMHTRRMNSLAATVRALDGMVLVPREPEDSVLDAMSVAHTKAMVAMFGRIRGSAAHREAMRAARRAMITAAERSDNG